MDQNQKAFHRVKTDISKYLPSNIAGMQYRPFYNYKSIYWTIINQSILNKFKFNVRY